MKIQVFWMESRVRGMRLRITSFHLWCVLNGLDITKADASLQNGINSNPPPKVGNFFVIAPAVLCPLSRMCSVLFFLLV